MNFKAFLAISILVLTSFLMSSTASASALLLAEGSWELIPNNDPRTDDLEKVHRCSVEPLKVKIDIKAMRYTAQFGQNEELIEADILDSGDNFLQLKYDNEERKMDNGELQVWRMLFTSTDVFVWVRQDWIVDGEVKGATQARRRCTAPMV